MNFLNKSRVPEPPASSSPNPTPQVNLHQAFSALQAHCSGLLHAAQTQTLFNLNPSSLKTHLHSALTSLGNRAKHGIEAGAWASGSASCSGKTPAWARISGIDEKRAEPGRYRGSSLSTEAIEERLAGVPVYALCNSSDEFVLVTGVRTQKNLGLFCLGEGDAETLLEHMKIMDPSMRRNSKVVPVALNKVFQLKVDGVSFRLIPEASQIKNALREREKVGLTHKEFLGVPVFQSQSLILRSENETFRPVFFRKEDLEKSLQRASLDQDKINPALRPGGIQVAVLEEIIKGMQDTASSRWDDVIFVPPGFDVSTNPAQLSSTSKGW